MDFETWDVDLASGEARHACGCIIRIEGDPQNPSSVDPSHFPKSLNFIDQARLLRCGVQALANAAEQGGSGARLGQAQSPAKSRTVRELEEKARMFAENPGRPKRAVLSLKRNREEKVTE
ncbi:hypothetical protein [Gilvimarinus algae]|uniref:Uncharacterized protein n=1 Tax=Gilvimarinus algae TaxID=3058037 RepID=A0ABT8TFZ0_9GAMM|nr:hypothetical protein [Gilvimarinus sp. SDUM040014]MDO3382979.1 hypothetical protein [Gilvimarinus sp. SDUM040014]